MLNRATNIFHDSTSQDGPDGRPWQVDRRPAVRLFWLFVLLLLPLVAVVARLADLQGCLTKDFASAFDWTAESTETIPTRDGRILASDGRVLAYDIQRFAVRVHYRWLEEPADEGWLRQQTLSRLSPPDRKDPARVEAKKQEVLALRTQMWDRLARLTGNSPESLAAERARIQRRVERIVSNVAGRRQQRLIGSQQPSPEDIDGADAAWWQRAWRTVISTLTTPPQRIKRDPIVVKEELDYHRLAGDVTLQAAAQIEAHPQEYPGLRIETSTTRAYPYGSLAAHIIGSRLRINAEELKARQARLCNRDPLGYQPGDRIGKTGLERAYEEHLHGLNGLRRVLKNRRGEVIRAETVREPRIGGDLMLTLNLALQEQMEELLDETLVRLANVDDDATVRPESSGACIVAIDVHTGAVLAAASAPRYDLELLVNPGREAWRLLIEDPRRPFFPRATRMTLPPGSVFKVLTSVALMESRQFDPDEKNYCRGFLDHPNRYRCYIYRYYGVGHGEMDLTDALSRSCNVYFFAAARKVGPQPIVKWAQRFGFGQPTGIDLPGEPGGNLPQPPVTDNLRWSAEVERRNGPEGRPPVSRWHRGDTLGLAIGQSRLTVTPMQIARLMAAIANDGYLVTPYLVKSSGPRILGAESAQIIQNRRPRRIPGLAEGTLERIREGLRKAVADPRGTGYKTVRLQEIAIAGKTGTAEVGRGKRDHAWFAGYVPAERPRVAFVVVLEHAGPGSKAAGPLARQLVQAMLALGILQPTRVAQNH